MCYCQIISVFWLFFGHSVAILNRDLMAIDVNDVLSEKLMPITFLSLQTSSKNRNVSADRNGELQLFQTDSFADFDSAYNLMKFHRKMIQNYKCNNYIAKQILSDIVPIKLHNRLGTAANSTGM